MTINDYALLRQRITEAGLFRRYRGWFAWKSTQVAIGVTVSIIVLFLSDTLWVQLLNAAFLAFVSGQVGLLGHDAGHQQIFKRKFFNNLIAYPCGFLLGISTGQWNEKHNAHHAHPNHEDMDPDIDFALVAFSEKQAKASSGLARFIIRQQGWLFLPMLSFVFVTLRKSSFIWVVKNFRQAWLEAVFLASHFVTYFAVIFLALPWVNAIIFIVVHQFLWGFYLGFVFAPNHKGMLITDATMELDFVREQVLTSRNVKPGWITDFVYGGLNYQIEHHLFPNLPRCTLGKARKIVKEFCAERGISYHETSVWQSLREILGHMRMVAKSA